jgi:hypothetical protein
MMILAIGNDPQRVDLMDIGDVIYYKQQKFFSDAQLARSNDLRRAIKAGKITVLQKYGNVDQEFVIDSQAPYKAVSKETSKIDLVLEKLAALEKSAKSPAADGAVVDILLERIAKIEQRIAGLSGPSVDASLADSLKQIAEKSGSSSKDTAILDRLESILDRMGSGGSSASAPEEPLRPEEVYVPTVSVEDGNTHIKLDVRPVETAASDLDASLAALKKLKSHK